jgi:hypothetical protein
VKQATKSSPVAGWSLLCSSNLQALDLLIRERERERKDGSGREWGGEGREEEEEMWCRGGVMAAADGIPSKLLFRLGKENGEGGVVVEQPFQERMGRGEVASHVVREVGGRR